jgi:hypothetical protein
VRAWLLPATLLAVLAGLVLALPGAEAQTHQCPKDGSLLLVFRNPDLQPGTDGFIRAQGQFFVQFQAIGARAGEITTFGFSFGPHTQEFDESACDTPQPAPWVTGTYIPNYRADRDPADGFFIPVKTTLVPDGTYAAAVHAYDAANNELARFWAKAVVDNCDTATTPAQERCADKPDQLAAHDKTAPWPILLPGDGQALEGHTFTVEFGEPISNWTIDLNGEDITSQMVAWDGRLWDGDVFPDYGPGGASGAISPPCSQPYHTCERYGPAFEWKGRPLTNADVIRVRATDMSNNTAVKDIHIGSSVAGGAVTEQIPILSYTVNPTRAETTPGGTALFHFNITNSGGGTAHPFPAASAPEGWTLAWDPTHVPVPPGTTLSQTLLVTVPAGAAPGVYRVNATLKYAAGGTEKELPQPLDVEVKQAAGAATTSSTSGTETKGTPIPLPLLSVAAALGAQAWMRRRASRDPGARS